MNMEKRSKTQNLLLMITLFISTASIMGDSVVGVVTSVLYKQYDAWAVNLMISGPSIAGLIMCPLAGRMCDKMDKKKIMLVGYILYAISAISGVAVDNQIYIIVMRFVATGISYGLTSTAALGIIAECYADEEFRGKVIGWYNAAMALIGGVMGLIAGVLGARDWKLAWAVNWFAVPVILMILFFVPACPPIHTSEVPADGENVKKGTDTKAKGEKGWYKPLIPLLASFFVMGLCYYTIITMMDLYVADNQLGTSAFTGLLGTVGTVGSFIACSAFGYVYKKLQDKSAIPSYLIMAVSFLLLGLFPSKPMALITCTIMGAAWGNAYSYWWMRCTVVVPENMAGTAIGITGTINSICGFPVPYIFLFLKGLMNTGNSARVFPVYAVVSLVVAVTASDIISKVRGRQQVRKRAQLIEEKQNNPEKKEKCCKLRM